MQTEEGEATRIIDVCSQMIMETEGIPSVSDMREKKHSIEDTLLY